LTTKKKKQEQFQKQVLRLSFIKD